MSSKAVIAAVNDALAQTTGEESPVTVPDAQTTATKTETEPDVQTSATKTDENPVDQPVITEPIVEPDVETSATKKDEQPVDKAIEPDAGAFVGEALSFNTSFKAEAEFEGDLLAALNVYEKAVGGEADYAPSADEAAYQAYFIGKALPLDVESVSIPGVPAYQAQAVAVAVNQAYEEWYSVVSKSGFAFYVLGYPSVSRLCYGESISFFTQYTVTAVISSTAEGDTLTGIITASARPAGADEIPFNEEDILDVSTLESLLIGQTLPLDPAAFGAVGSLRGDQVTAIIIALNQAYENQNPVLSMDFLAGQQ